ncbi:hypothetical protein C8F04DRAFT_1199350 [Mycena alexandri]|uniref:Uncharacterized protein n=1 Tax=Mycena alexandri TaxID=1745969 RepID=A0AAD6S1E2_9AGAR|nr:hypothetical protein C8F04DRAFT_1199350 [Mycena alexandri]
MIAQPQYLCRLAYAERPEPQKIESAGNNSPETSLEKNDGIQARFRDFARDIKFSRDNASRATQDDHQFFPETALRARNTKVNMVKGKRSQQDEVKEQGGGREHGRSTRRVTLLKTFRLASFWRVNHFCLWSLETSLENCSQRTTCSPEPAPSGCLHSATRGPAHNTLGRSRFYNGHHRHSESWALLSIILPTLWHNKLLGHQTAVSKRGLIVPGCATALQQAAAPHMTHLVKTRLKPAIRAAHRRRIYGCGGRP